MSKRAFDPQIQQRIGDMWRVHKNRMDAGLGGTYRESGFHEGMTQDTHILVPNLNTSLWKEVTGVVTDKYISN
jgi:hypothetical protein